MAETIPGGAALNEQGRWVDANGQPLSKEQIAEAEKLFAERDAEREKQEKAALALAAMRDPIARSLTAALRPQSGAVEPPAKKT